MYIKPQTVIPEGFPITKVAAGKSGSSQRPRRQLKHGPRTGPIGERTRVVDAEFYKAQLKQGCPHCGSELQHKIKGYFINIEDYDENDFVFLGVYSSCLEEDCPVKVFDDYYYVSPTRERIFLPEPEGANE